MGLNLNRLKVVARQLSEKELYEARYRDENRDWLQKSALIALEIRRYLRLKGMTQSQLAEKLGISPAMVTKLLSGKENMSIKTICGIERVLQFELLKVPSYEESIYVKCDLPQMSKEKLDFEDGNQTFCKVIKMNKEILSKNKVIAV